MANSKMLALLVALFLLSSVAIARDYRRQVGGLTTTLGGAPVSPDWLYLGKSCMSSEFGIRFQAQFSTCNYQSKDRFNDRYTCDKTSLKCSGPKCPSRACGSAAKEPPTQGKSGLTRSAIPLTMYGKK